MSLFSLWLIPEEKWEKRLTSLIVKLARDYQRLPFTPHATVVTGITGSEEAVVAATAVLAESTAPPVATVEKLAAENSYYRFLYCALTKSPAMACLNERACNVFNLASLEYHPHVSLVYADPAALDASVVVSALAESSAPPVRGDVLRFDRLVLMETSGGEREWEKAAEYPLR